MSKVIITVIDDQDEEFRTQTQNIDLDPGAVQNKLSNYLELLSNSSSQMGAGLRANRRLKSERAHESVSTEEGIKKYGFRTDHPFTAAEIQTILEYEALIRKLYIFPLISWQNAPIQILNHYLAQACDQIEDGVYSAGAQIDSMDHLIQKEGSSGEQLIHSQNLDPEFLAIARYLIYIGDEYAHWESETSLNTFDWLLNIPK